MYSYPSIVTDIRNSISITILLFPSTEPPTHSVEVQPQLVHQQPLPSPPTNQRQRAPTLSQMRQKLHENQEVRQQENKEFNAAKMEFLLEEKAAKRRQWQLATQELELRVEIARRELQWKQELYEMKKKKIQNAQASNIF